MTGFKAEVGRKNIRIYNIPVCPRVLDLCFEYDTRMYLPAAIRMLCYIMLRYVMGNGVNTPPFLDLRGFRLREHILWKRWSLQNGSLQIRLLIQDGRQFEGL
jgi:hypothetical protein